jgi:thiamine pyrophosphokinase
MNAGTGRRGLVVADGDVATRAALDAAWPGWAQGVALVVAADGGARHADALGLPIDRWVGDGDSLGVEEIARLRERGVAVDLYDPDKDETDTELAIRAAISGGADAITIVGAFGGVRLDHALANVSLLMNPLLDGRPADLLDAGARIRLLHAPGPDGRAAAVALPGRVGDLISLIPFGVDGEGLTSEGLRYPLRDEQLAVGSTRGISNVRISTPALVSMERGLLLVIETPATLSP